MVEKTPGGGLSALIPSHIKFVFVSAATSSLCIFVMYGDEIASSFLRNDKIAFAFFVILNAS